MQIQVIDPEDEQQEENAPESPTTSSTDSPHTALHQMSLDVPMSPTYTNVDSFSRVHVVPVAPKSSCTVVLSSATESSLETPHDNLENVFDANSPYAILSSVSLPKIGTSAMNFDRFMSKACHDMTSEQTLVTLQTEASPRITTAVQTEPVSTQATIVVTEVISLDLPPWLSLITPKRKRQEISPDVFDFQQLRKSKPRLPRKTK